MKINGHLAVHIFPLAPRLLVQLQGLLLSSGLQLPLGFHAPLSLPVGCHGLAQLRVRVRNLQK